MSAVATKRRISKAEKLKLAVRARDAALSLVQKFGGWEGAPALPSGARMFGATIEGYDILYRTPFQKLPEVPASLKYLRALTGKLGPLPYAIDVWRPEGGKLLFCEWSNSGEFTLVKLDVDSVGKFLTLALRYRQRCTDSHSDG
jgi:hypothetical protein